MNNEKNTGIQNVYTFFRLRVYITEVYVQAFIKIFVAFHEHSRWPFIFAVLYI